MIIVNHGRYLIFIRPRSVLKILFSKFWEGILIQVENFICYSLIDHVTEVNKEFLDLKIDNLLSIRLKKHEYFKIMKKESILPYQAFCSMKTCRILGHTADLPYEVRNHHRIHIHPKICNRICFNLQI